MKERIYGPIALPDLIPVKVTRVTINDVDTLLVAPVSDAEYFVLEEDTLP